MPPAFRSLMICGVSVTVWMCPNAILLVYVTPVPAARSTARMTMVWLWAPTTVEVTEKSDRGGVGVGDAVGEAVGTPEVAVLVAEGVPVPAGGDVGVVVGRDVGVFPGGDIGVFSGGEVGVAADPESLLSSSPHPATFNAAGAAATAMAKRIKNSLRSMYDLLCSRCLSTPLVIPGAIDQGGSTSLANMAPPHVHQEVRTREVSSRPNGGAEPPGWGFTPRMVDEDVAGSSRRGRNATLRNGCGQLSELAFIIPGRTKKTA